MATTNNPIPLPAAFLETTASRLPGLAESLDSESPVSIRLNPFKPGRSMPEGRPVPWAEPGEALYLDSRPLFTADPVFHGGAYYVQEAGSMFIGWLLRLAYRVVFCVRRYCPVAFACRLAGYVSGFTVRIRSGVAGGGFAWIPFRRIVFYVPVLIGWLFGRMHHIRSLCWMIWPQQWFCRRCRGFITAALFAIGPVSRTYGTEYPYACDQYRQYIFKYRVHSVLFLPVF